MPNEVTQIRRHIIQQNHYPNRMLRKSLKRRVFKIPAPEKLVQMEDQKMVTLEVQMEDLLVGEETGWESKNPSSLFTWMIWGQCEKYRSPKRIHQDNLYKSIILWPVFSLDEDSMQGAAYMNGIGSIAFVVELVVSIVVFCRWHFLSGSSTSQCSKFRLHHLHLNDSFIARTTCWQSIPPGKENRF